jgi:hypothetical protein
MFGARAGQMAKVQFDDDDAHEVKDYNIKSAVWLLKMLKIH